MGSSNCFFEAFFLRLVRIRLCGQDEAYKERRAGGTVNSDYDKQGLHLVPPESWRVGLLVDDDLGQVKQLASDDQMKAWTRRNHIRQKDLAAMLEITPQAVTEIFRGRNRPTAEQVLAPLEIMSRDPDAPKKGKR